MLQCLPKEQGWLWNKGILISKLLLTCRPKQHGWSTAVLSDCDSGPDPLLAALPVSHLAEDVSKVLALWWCWMECPYFNLRNVGAYGSSELWSHLQVSPIQANTDDGWLNHWTLFWYKAYSKFMEGTFHLSLVLALPKVFHTCIVDCQMNKEDVAIPGPLTRMVLYFKQL